MNKKIIAAIFGIGMGLGATGIAAASSYCDYVYNSCIESGVDAFTCSVRREACEGGIVW